MEGNPTRALLDLTGGLVQLRGWKKAGCQPPPKGQGGIDVRRLRKNCRKTVEKSGKLREIAESCENLQKIARKWRKVADINPPRKGSLVGTGPDWVRSDAN